MHLMSFYATPYASRHREDQLSGKLGKIRGVWFAAGLLCGLGLMYVFGGGEDAPQQQVASAQQESLEHVQQAQGTGRQAEEGATEASVQQAANDRDDKEEALAPLFAGASVGDQSPVAGVQQITWPREVEVTIASGDTLIEVLQRQGIDHVAAHRLAKQVNKTFNLRRLKPGHTLSMVLEKDAGRDVEDGITPTKLNSMDMFVSKLETVKVTAVGEEQYKVSKVKKKLIKEPARARSVIDSSLYMAAAQQGMPDRAIAATIKNFSYDIDFQRDIRAGDIIDVMYEVKKTEDGEVIGSGDVLYAMLKSRGKTYKHYRYVNSLGLPAYYNEKGESIVKQLLKTPIDGARLSSRYGMRKHPILGYSKMHTGVDFAAPTGTPIYAAGDGVVTFSGRKGGYGNMVIVKHNGTYTTAYAHAHRIARGIRKGKKVRQGQTIAYVGSTGRSTGPHLHYEIHKYGKKVNPLKVKFTGGDKLTGKRLAQFKQHVQKVKTQLAGLKASGADQETVALAQ